MLISELSLPERAIRPVRALTASALALMLAVGLAGSAGAVDETTVARQAPTVRLSLSALEIGEPPSVPFMTSDGRIIDGDTELHVIGHATTLLGEHDASYVYARRTQRGANKDVRRVTPDGVVTKVASIRGSDQVVLSDDGDWLAVLTSKRRQSILRVVSVATGNDTLDTTVDLGWPNLLDVGPDQVLLSSWRQRGTWSVPTDIEEPVRRLTKRVGYLADIDANRLATFTKDPYLDGCSVVSRLNRPTKALTRSCTERADELSPTGRKVANVALLSDGIGPSTIVTRRASGKRVAAYSAPYYFGDFLWEDDDTLLMHVFSRKHSALVRCTGADCEIAVPDLGKPQARVATPAALRTAR